MCVTCLKRAGGGAPAGSIVFDFLWSSHVKIELSIHCAPVALQDNSRRFLWLPRAWQLRSNPRASINTARIIRRRSPLRCLYAAGAHVEHFSHEPGRGYVSGVSLHLTTKSYCAVYFNGCCYANCNYVSPQGSFKFHHFTLSHLQERIITTFLAASHFKALSYIEEWLTRLHFDTLKYDL